MIKEEYKLAAPAADWIEAQGYEVFNEVPHNGCWIDLVGRKQCNGHSELIAVELKTSWSKDLFFQCHRKADYIKTWGCTGSKPKSQTIEKFRRQGIGMLFIGKPTEEIISPDPSKFLDCFAHNVSKLSGTLELMNPGRQAGAAPPTDHGPARLVLAAALKYREKIPGAPFREMFEEIPNHYSSAGSMSGAIKRLAEEIYWENNWDEFNKEKKDMAAISQARHSCECEEGDYKVSWSGHNYDCPIHIQALILVIYRRKERMKSVWVAAKKEE